MPNSTMLKAEFDDELSDYPVMLTVNQVAELLNVSKTSIFRLLKMGQLERVSFKLTGEAQPSVRIPAESVRKLFTSWVGDSND
jgi:excisionase family DNA binding protein